MRNLPRFLLLITVAGCNSASNDSIEFAKPASFNADKVARAAFAKLDRNGNGMIEYDEAQSCPALASAFEIIDAQQSKTISLPQLIARFEKYQTPLNGKVPACACVTLDGMPLAGAKVSFVPETFFEGILKTATGETDAAGRCREFMIDGQRCVGLAAGLYKITVEGDEVPARYNAATTLGSEVFTTGRGGEIAIKLNLTR